MVFEELDEAARGGRGGLERLDRDADAHDALVIPPVGLVRRASSSGCPDAQVRRALDDIRLHAHEGITAADVARLFGARSRRSIEMRFKAATGETMTDALLAVRLARACDLLATGRTSISAIANRCGWRSDLAFRKAFKARFGLTPTAYRRNAASGTSSSRSPSSASHAI